MVPWRPGKHKRGALVALLAVLAQCVLLAAANDPEVVGQLLTLHPQER